MIELRFQHERAAWVRTIRTAANKLRFGRIQWAIVGAGALLAVATQNWMLAGVLVLAVGWFWWIPNLLWKRSPALHAPLHVQLDEEGMLVQSTLADSRTSWAVWQRMIETADALVLVQQRRLITILPKSAFASDAELDQARALITAHLPK